MLIFVFVIAFALGYCVGNDKLRSLITGKAKLKVEKK